MRIGSRGLLVLLATISILAAACSSDARGHPRAERGANRTGRPADPGHAQGRLHVHAEPARRGQARQGRADQLRLLVRLDGIPLFSPQYLAGYERTLPEAQAILPMNGQAIAPASAVQDPNEQIAQIDALFKADQIDCLSIQSTGTDAFTKIVERHHGRRHPGVHGGRPVERQRVHELHPDLRQGRPPGRRASWSTA